MNHAAPEALENFLNPVNDGERRRPERKRRADSATALKSNRPAGEPREPGLQNEPGKGFADFQNELGKRVR
jgi:hypothetical protein